MRQNAGSDLGSQRRQPPITSKSRMVAGSQNRLYNPPGARPDASHVITHSVWKIKTAPSEQLGSPGDIRVFTIGEEIRVEEIISIRDVGDHLPAIEGGGGAGAEYVFHLAEAAIIGFMPTPIEMAHGGREIDPGRVDERFGRA